MPLTSSSRTRGRAPVRRSVRANVVPPHVMARLRGDVARRPRVDPGLAGGLRAWLEDGAAESLAGAPPAESPVVVDRWALATGERPDRAREVTVPLARGALVGTLFRQFVVTGRIGDPVADALSALRADRSNTAVVEFLLGLPADERALLDREVAAHAATLLATWPPVAPGWLPRTADRVSVSLAGGRVVLVGLVDLVLGAPARERASVCLVDVRSGERRDDHRFDRQFHGLLETVRAGAPPFRVATYYTATGEMDVDEVDDDLLSGAVRRTLDGVRLAVWASRRVPLTPAPLPPAPLPPAA